MIPNIFSSLPRITRMVFGQPWMILPAFHRETIVPQLLAARQQQAALSSVRADDYGEDSPEQKERNYNQKLCALDGDWVINADNRRARIPYNMDARSRIAQVNVNGIIGKGLDSWDMMCGGVCVDQIQEAMEHLAEFQPEALAMHFNTPGGTVTGVPETAEFIRQWSKDVAPVHAYTDTLCASAGIYLAYGADTFTAAASSDVGSIGVYCAVIDSFQFYQDMGIDVHLLASGWSKGQGYPGTKVSEKYIASVKADVDRHAARFFEHVMLARGEFIEQEAAMVSASGDEEISPQQWAARIMQGQCWTAQDAPACLLDGIYPNRRAHIAALRETLTSAQ